MKRFLLFLLCVHLSFAAALIGVRLVLSSVWKPSSAALISAEMRLIEQAWCWREVCPGKTALTAAQAHLQTPDDVLTQSEIGLATVMQWERRADPTWQGTISAAGKTIETIHLELKAGTLRLGDVMAQFGRPSFTFSQIAVSQQNKVRALGLTMFICFEGGLCFTVEPAGCNEVMRFEAHLPIRQVFLYPSTWARAQFGVVRNWQALNHQYVRCPVVIY